MIKVLAAFLSPFVLSLCFALYNIFILIIENNNSFTITFEGFIFIYIYALPMYLLIGVPCSIIIDYVDKGIQWVNYIIAGAMAGIIINIIFIMSGKINNIFIFDWSIVGYMTAAFAFYLTLKALEFINWRKLS